MRKMPLQKPGSSQQNYQTPSDFIRAVKDKFSIRNFIIDLAAERSNTQAQQYFSEKKDSLKQDWTKAIGYEGAAWLNPPYENISKWSKKCCEATENLESQNSRIFFLVPASVGSNWFAETYPYCQVFALNGRIVFSGHTAPYPKDCILAIFGGDFKDWNTMSIWRWK